MMFQKHGSNFQKPERACFICGKTSHIARMCIHNPINKQHNNHNVVHANTQSNKGLRNDGRRMSSGNSYPSQWDEYDYIQNALYNANKRSYVNSNKGRAGYNHGNNKYITNYANSFSPKRHNGYYKRKHLKSQTELGRMFVKGAAKHDKSKAVPVTTAKANKGTAVKDANAKHDKQAKASVTAAPSTKVVKPAAKIWKSKFSSHDVIDFEKLKETQIIKKTCYYDAEGKPKTSLGWVPKRTNFLFMCRASQQSRERAFGM